VKIVRPISPVDPQFYSSVRISVMETHQRLIAAGLASPNLREYLNSVRIILSNRMRGCAGTASIRKHVVRLNARLLTEHRDRVPEVLAHEVAHLIDGYLHGRSSHGPQWKELMGRLGFEAKRCHGMDTSRLKCKSVAHSLINTAS